MAGSGWKTWTRERLSQSDMQTYLQDQVTLHYASAAARDAAIPVGSRFVGMRALTTNDLFEWVWDGARWARAGNRRTTGYVSGLSVDSAGALSIAHGLGFTPTTILITLGPQASSAIDAVLKLIHRNADSTLFIVQAFRTDTSAVFPSTPVSFSWSAEL